MEQTKQTNKMKKETAVKETSKEVVNESTGEVKRSIDGLKFDVQSEDLEKWDFNKNPLFFGQYKRTEAFEFDEVQKDKSLIHKKFDLYVFENFESGQRYHIDSCHSIQKFIEEEKKQKVDFSKFVYSIQFLGKKMVNEKPLNTFTISKAAL